MAQELGVAMYDDDQEALAGEYVLGTLAADERERAEALRSFDAGFEAAVRRWERRLGELNVMVEAVEPPAEVWDKIKVQVGPVEATGETGLSREQEAISPVAALASTLPSTVAPEWSTPTETPAQTPAEASAALSSPGPAPTTKIERNADVIQLARRVKRWRRATLGVGALAALLAVELKQRTTSDFALTGAPIARPSDLGSLPARGH